jgi:hypothetical protein
LVLVPYCFACPAREQQAKKTGSVGQKLSLLQKSILHYELFNIPFLSFLGASGAAYALLSAHLANIILHHHSMSRPFLRLTGLLFVASLEIGVGIYRRYAPPEPERPQVSFAAHLAGVVSGITFGLVILRNYEQKLSERRAWWVTIFLLLGVSTVAFLYQRLRRNPTFTLFCTGHDCPIP